MPHLCRVLSLAYIAAVLAFAFLQNTFFNYGYNYLNFSSPGFAVVFIGALLLLGCVNTFCLPEKQWLRTRFFWIALLVAMPFVFWHFRTEIHCFGGDGAVGALPSDAVGLRDFIPRGKRLDGLWSGALFKFLNSISIFDEHLAMPSILRTQIYSVIVGGLFVAAASCFFANGFRFSAWRLRSHTSSTFSET